MSILNKYYSFVDNVRREEKKEEKSILSVLYLESTGKERSVHVLIIQTTWYMYMYIYM